MLSVGRPRLSGSCWYSDICCPAENSTIERIIITEQCRQKGGPGHSTVTIVQRRSRSRYWTTLPTMDQYYSTVGLELDLQITTSDTLHKIRICCPVSLLFSCSLCQRPVWPWSAWLLKPKLCFMSNSDKIMDQCYVFYLICLLNIEYIENWIELKTSIFQHRLVVRWIVIFTSIYPFYRGFMTLIMEHAAISF